MAGVRGICGKAGALQEVIPGLLYEYMGRARLLKIVVGLALIFQLLKIALESMFGKVGGILGEPWNLVMLIVCIICAVVARNIGRDGLMLGRFRVTKEEAPETYNFIERSLWIVSFLCFIMIAWQLISGLGAWEWVMEKASAWIEQGKMWVKGLLLFLRMMTDGKFFTDISLVWD